jgi:hypothetical protein
MKKKIAALLMFVLPVITGVHAQISAPEFKKYDWEADPKPHPLSAEELKENTVILKDFRLNEFAYDIKGNLMMYVTRHKIIRLNSDKSIEENNKMFIPMYDVEDVMEVKARSIAKDGKVNVLSPSSIKDVENFENAGHFKIFAFEGVEIGSEVEYLYTLKKQASFFGTEIVQSDELRKNIEIRIVSPSNLRFEARSYNKFPDFSEPIIEDEKRSMFAKMEVIPALKEERYSAYRADLMRVEYKLSYNEAKGDKRLFTWNDASAFVYERLVLDKKERSKVTSFLKKIKLDKKSSDEEKIRKIENYVKTNIIIKDDPSADLEDMATIIKTKVANQRGVIRLFVELYKQAGIDYQVVLTCDRMDQKFDGDFDTWNFLDKYLLYFPTVDNYIAPGEMFSRFGYVPPELTANKGLFITPVTVGDFTTGIGKVKDIPTRDYKQSYDNIYADVKFDADFTETSMHLKREFSGYSALGLQPIFSYLPEENKKETTDNLLKLAADDSKITNPVVSNYDESSVLIKPFTVEGDVKSSSMLEKAGEKFLFKVGNVIGPQAELYQEDKRRTDAENEFNRGYYREITVEIPEGYKVTNLDALNLAVYSGDQGNPDAQFVSTYKVDGNKIRITIDENYRKIIFPLDQFESFRKVINAAADFNKVVLFIEKK